MESPDGILLRMYRIDTIMSKSKATTEYGNYYDSLKQLFNPKFKRLRDLNLALQLTL